MNMTVRELIANLEDMDPNAEVRLAHQPSWPFEYSIANVVQVDPPRIVSRAEFDAMTEEEQEQLETEADNGNVVYIDEGQELPETIVYIGEGTQLGYLPVNASYELGWK